MNEPVILSIPVDRIRMSHNDRTKIDQEELARFAQSLLNTQGVIHFPTGYRPEDDAVDVELMTGERRWRAYQMLRNQGHEAFAVLPVRMIERPSPAAEHKWKLVENVQRVDLRPSELAAALARMLGLVDEESGRPIWTHASLAEEIGKDKSTISELLMLQRAPAEVVRAVDEGRCALQVGALIGGLPPEMREGAAAEMVLREIGPMTAAQAREWVRDRYRRDLRRADFSKEQVGLDGLPACEQCQWWGGNRDDVAGMNAIHVCLNPACYARKQKAVAVASGEAQGARMLEGAEAMEVFEPHSGRVAMDSGYVEVVDRPSPALLDGGGRAGVQVPTWAELLRDSGLTEVRAMDEHGTWRRLVETGPAIRAAVQSRWGGIFRDGVAKEYLSKEEREAERHARAAGDREKRAVMIEGLCELRRCVEGQPEDSDRELLTALIRHLMETTLKADDLAMLAEVWGVDGREGRTLDALAECLGSRGAMEMIAALVLVVLIRRVRYEGFSSLVAEDGEPLGDLCRAAGFDPAAWNRTMKRREGAAVREGR